MLNYGRNNIQYYSKFDIILINIKIKRRSKMRELVKKYIEVEKEYSKLWWSTKRELNENEILPFANMQEDLLNQMSKEDLMELIALTNNKQAQIYYAKILKEKEMAVCNGVSDGSSI